MPIDIRSSISNTTAVSAHVGPQAASGTSPRFDDGNFGVAILIVTLLIKIA
jgi:hypothetical protein